MRKDEEYGKMIESIRNMEPVLEGGEELTASIVRRIGCLDPKRKRGRGLFAAGYALAAASVILLGLFIDQVSIPGEPFFAPDVNYADVHSSRSPYKGMPKEEIVNSISERIKRAEERTRLTKDHYEIMYGE